MERLNEQIKKTLKKQQWKNEWQLARKCFVITRHIQFPIQSEYLLSHVAVIHFSSSERVHPVVVTFSLSNSQKFSSRGGENMPIKWNVNSTTKRLWQSQAVFASSGSGDTWLGPRGKRLTRFIIVTNRR